jgi:hypothetical protein
MFDVVCTTQAALRPNVLAIRTCVTFRNTARLGERLAHDRMAARALATVVMKKEAGYRRLTRHALIIKQDQYNSTARTWGMLTWQIARTAGHCEDLTRIQRPLVKCRVVLSRLIATAPNRSTLAMACSRDNDYAAGNVGSRSSSLEDIDIACGGE